MAWALLLDRRMARLFKGQQAPAIVLVDIDATPERKDTFQRLLYSSMTRATVFVVKADNPLNESLLGQT